MCNNATKEHINHNCEDCINWNVEIDKDPCKTCIETDCRFKPKSEGQDE